MSAVWQAQPLAAPQRQALEQGRGVGSALLGAVEELARRRGCKRLWLVTTNDNTHALAFYQRRGFSLAALHRDAVTEARKTLKPFIPLVGEGDLPIRDELELEKRLCRAGSPAL